MKKKIVSLVVTAVMLVALLPVVPVGAATNIKIGDYIQMGTYYDEPILWRCVDIDENGPLILSDKIICFKEYDAPGNNNIGSHGTGAGRGEYRKKYGSNEWRDSNIRSWLNSREEAGYVKWLCGNPPKTYSDEAGFLTSFTEKEIGAIYPIKRTEKVYDEYSNESYVEITDIFFLPSREELEAVDIWVSGDLTQYASQFAENKKMDYYGNRYTFWTRSPKYSNMYGYYINYGYSLYGPFGSITDSFANELNGVLPAFYLSESATFTSGEGTEANPYTVEGSGDTTPILPATPSEWAANDINSAIELGLIPEELQSDWQTPITRFDFCKLAVALYMKVRPNAVLVPTDKFSDIGGMSSEDNYKIGTAVGLGIVSGYEDGTFRPYNEITRQEAAAMLMRTGKALGLSDPLAVLNKNFVDCGSAPSWAMEGINYVYDYGIMSGTDIQGSNITFEPLSTYTREQAMVTFYRLFGKIQQGVTDASDDEFIPKTPYETAYNNYLKAVKQYKRAVENALDTDKQEKELKKNMKAAMLEHWIINGAGIKRSEIPDSVYEAMYMFTGSLGDFKILSKNYNWANTKGLIEGCIDMTVTTLSNIGGGKHKYLVDGTYITIDGTTIGKNGTGTISWDGKMATFVTNPKETTDTFLSLVEQCTELVADIMNDEFKEVSKMLTGYSTVEDFLKQKLSNKYNNFLKEMGLGDFNETAGNMLAMLNNASNLMMSGSNQEILDNMIKLNNDEYDTSVTNLMVSEAFDDVKTAQTKLIEAAKEKFYDQYGN